MTAPGGSGAAARKRGRPFLRLLPPLLLSAVVFGVFYLGGDAYKAFGVAAVDTTRRALKYVLGAVAFFSLAVFVQRVLQTVVFDGLVVRSTGARVPKLLRQISSLVVYLVAVSACAGIVFDQDLTVLWAASGVAGLVLGMALKELLEDVFAGIAMNIDRAVSIGDRIQLQGGAGITGQLLEISWRTARILDVSGNVVVIPNSNFSAATMTNLSQPEPVRLVGVEVVLPATVEVGQATRLLTAAAFEGVMGFGEAATLARAVEVRAVRADGVEYVIWVRCAVEKAIAVRAAVLARVLEHLGAAGLTALMIPGGATTPAGGPVTTAPASERVAALLARNWPFASLPAQVRRELAEAAVLRVRPARQVVVQHGEVSDVVLLVVEGVLTAEAGGRSRRAAGLPRLRRPGDALDPTAPLLGEAHGATVQARSEVVLAELDPAALARALRDASARSALARALAAEPEEVGRRTEVVLQARLDQMFGRGLAVARL